jgi:SET domain-containing protein
VHKGKIRIKAIKRIKPGDEITYNYGKNYFETFIKPMGCRCQSCERKRAKQAAA